MGKLDNVETNMEKVQRELSKTDEIILNGEKALDAVKELLAKEVSNEMEQDKIRDKMSQTLETLDTVKDNLDKLSSKDEGNINTQNNLPQKSETISSTPDEGEEDLKIKEVD